MSLAGLDWQVVKNQNYARNPQGKVVPVSSYSIFRDTDGAELASNVGEGFTVKQNRECFQFVDDLLQANGGAHYDSAGALGNGATIWCAVRVPRADITVNGRIRANPISSLPRHMTGTWRILLRCLPCAWFAVTRCVRHCPRIPES